MASRLVVGTLVVGVFPAPHAITPPTCPKTLPKNAHGSIIDTTWKHDVADSGNLRKI